LIKFIRVTIPPPKQKTEEHFICGGINFQEGDTVQTKVGIYGDITGYGKTLTILAFLTKYYLTQRKKTEYLKEKEIEEVFDISQIYTRYLQHHGKKVVTSCQLAQTLIIVNRQIASQWTEELEKTDLKWLGVVNRRNIPVDLDDLTGYEVLLVTDTMAKYLYESYRAYSWKRLVIDEPTENLVPYHFVADFNWLMTASYDQLAQVTSTKSILQQLFKNCQLGYCQSKSILRLFLIKNEDEFVRKSYQIDPIETVTHHYYENNLAKIAKGYLSDEIAELISAGNFKDAISSLGGSTSDSNIVELVTKNKKLQLKEAEFKYHKFHQKYVLEKNRDYKPHYDRWSEKKSQLEREISELNYRYEQSLKQGCPVCYDGFDQQQIILVPCCQNIICGPCLFNWLEEHPNCLYCRSTIDNTRLIYIERGTAESADPSSPELTPSPKSVKKRQNRLELIIDLIKEEPERKFIVVSYHGESFAPIKNYLSEQEIEYVEIKGSKQAIDQDLASLKEGRTRVLFLNCKYSCTGLNLQMMTDIILYHPMDQATVTQVVGRINRIGSREIRGEIQTRLHILTEGS